MKRIQILLCFALVFITNQAKATHAAGGYFEYTCINQFQYKVDFYFLRDCTGPAAPDQVTFELSNNSGYPCSVLSMLLVEQVTNVDFGCGNACDGGTVESNSPSFQLARYTTLVTLPFASTEWKISVTINARNIVDYANTTGYSGDMYLYCTINNTAGINNSSVKFTGSPFAVGCAANSGSSIYNIVNPDGDVLVYNLVEPMNGSCTGNGSIIHLGGTSAQMPVPSSSNFLISPAGDLSFSPTAIGESYFALEIQEFKLGVLAGKTRIDGIVFVTNCQYTTNMNFSNLLGDTDHDFSVSNVETNNCTEFTVEPSNPLVTISNVTIANNVYSTVNAISYNADGTATVSMCVNFPEDNECSSIVENIVVTASTIGTGGCIGQLINSPSLGVATNTYSFTKTSDTYCPENLYFTNRNPTSGYTLPSYAQAQNEIWVGDLMPVPPIYTPGLDGPLLGPVVHNGNVTLRAGTQIYLPNCQGGGTGCVTITGYADLLVEPINCSPECLYVPMTLTCKEHFNCNNEKFVVDVIGGVGPFNYAWTINGQTYYTSDPELDVHSIVSQVNNGQVSYICSVMDAVGQTEVCSGTALGTKRFYEDIRNNTTYFEYLTDQWGNASSAFGPHGYYYDGRLVVSNGNTQYGAPIGAGPAFIYDGVNWNPGLSINSPPYYGATEMEFTIWAVNSANVIVYKHLNLEGGYDWSIDNFSFYWNGYIDNNTDNYCSYYGTGEQFFNYRLIAKNCFSTVVPNPPISIQYPPPTNAHIENASFYIHDYCYSGAPSPVVAGIVTNNNISEFQNENLIIVDDEIESTPLTHSRGEIPNVVAKDDLSINCFPNPTNNEFKIVGNFNEIELLQILDRHGKIVLELKNIQSNQTINIDNFSKGIYQLVLTIPEVELKQTIKLVKL